MGEEKEGDSIISLLCLLVIDTHNRVIGKRA